ncbi:hypothetical protein BsWGS_22837 [Bradybaena similaris]
MPAQGATGYASKLLLFVNGRKVEVKDPDPELTLLEFLRRKRILSNITSCDSKMAAFLPESLAEGFLLLAINPFGLIME